MTNPFTFGYRRLLLVLPAAVATVLVAGCSTSVEEQAIVDLAETAGAEPDDIEVLVHEQVTWRDDTLGCLPDEQSNPPQPGQTTRQQTSQPTGTDQTGQPVAGYWIVLRLDGETVSYHGADDQPPIRCDNPDPDGAIHDAEP